MAKSQCSATTLDGSISCPYPASAGADKCLFHLPLLERANRGISQSDFHELIQEMIRSNGVIVLFNTVVDTIDLSQIDTSLLDIVTLKNVQIETLRLPERQVEAEITIGNCSLGTLVGDDVSGKRDLLFEYIAPLDTVQQLARLQQKQFSFPELTRRTQCAFGLPNVEPDKPL